MGKICVIGHSDNSIHCNIRINQHHSNINDQNNEYHTVEIWHFRIHSFSNIRTEILEHLEDKNNTLAKENDFMVQFSSIYPYFNYYFKSKNIFSAYDLFYNFNDLIAIYKGKNRLA